MYNDWAFGNTNCLIKFISEMQTNIEFIHFLRKPNIINMEIEISLFISYIKIISWSDLQAWYKMLPNTIFTSCNFYDFLGQTEPYIIFLFKYIVL